MSEGELREVFDAWKDTKLETPLILSEISRSSTFYPSPVWCDVTVSVLLQL